MDPPDERASWAARPLSTPSPTRKSRTNVIPAGETLNGFMTRGWPVAGNTTRSTLEWATASSRTLSFVGITTTSEGGDPTR